MPLLQDRKLIAYQNDRKLIAYTQPKRLTAPSERLLLDAPPEQLLLGAPAPIKHLPSSEKKLISHVERLLLTY